MLDNASWNGNEETRRAFGDKGCRLLYNAPYCQDLTPEEAAIRNLQQRFRGTKVLGTASNDDVLRVVENTVYEVMTPELMEELSCTGAVGTSNLSIVFVAMHLYNI